MSSIASVAVKRGDLIPEVMVLDLGLSSTPLTKATTVGLLVLFAVMPLPLGFLRCVGAGDGSADRQSKFAGPVSQGYRREVLGLLAAEATQVAAELRLPERLPIMPS